MAQLGRIWADGIWNTAIWNTAIWKQPVPDVEVPNVVGETQAAATSALQAEGFTVRVVRVFDEVIPDGQVISQSPTAGSDAPEGSQVTINVSKGPYVPGENGFIEPIQFIGFIQ